MISNIALICGLLHGASLVAQMVKNPSAMQESWVQSLVWEDPLEKGIATHSSILAWRIPWTWEPGGLQSMGLQRVGHNWVNTLCLFVAESLFFFFLLNNILSFGCTTVYISIQLLKDIMVAVKFWQLCIKLLYTSRCRFLCIHTFSTLLGKYQGARLLHPMVQVCLVLEETAKLSSKLAVPLALPPAMKGSSSCSISLQAYGVASILNFGLLISVW